MTLVAHRMMLSSQPRQTHQFSMRNKVGVLLVPSLDNLMFEEQFSQHEKQENVSTKM